MGTSVCQTTNSIIPIPEGLERQQQLTYFVGVAVATGDKGGSHEMWFSGEQSEKLEDVTHFYSHP